MHLFQKWRLQYNLLTVGVHKKEIPYARSEIKNFLTSISEFNSKFHVFLNNTFTTTLVLWKNAMYFIILSTYLLHFTHFKNFFESLLKILIISISDTSKIKLRHLKRIFLPHNLFKKSVSVQNKLFLITVYTYFNFLVTYATKEYRYCTSKFHLHFYFWSFRTPSLISTEAIAHYSL